jgi:thioredoxin reductase (NADPH)
MRSLMNSGRIPAYFRSVPTEITPSHVKLKFDDGATMDVPADFVLLLTGYEQDNALLRKAGVELMGPNQMPTFDKETMMTNVTGLYVAGTAIGGTQERYSVFIENCHDHTDKILRHAFGVTSGTRAMVVDMPES